MTMSRSHQAQEFFTFICGPCEGVEQLQNKEPPILVIQSCFKSMLKYNWARMKEKWNVLWKIICISSFFLLTEVCYL